MCACNLCVRRDTSAPVLTSVTVASFSADDGDATPIRFIASAPDTTDW